MVASAMKKKLPALMPRMPGDTIGLRRMLCMSAPETAKALPEARYGGARQAKAADDVAQQIVIIGKRSG